MYYAYLLECADGSFYGGYTVDLAARLRTHNAGKGSRYVRARLPARLAYYEVFSDKSTAMRREAALKALSHREKAALAAAFHPQEREVLTP